MAKHEKGHVRKNRKSKKDIDPALPDHLTWKCVACGFILGYADEDKTSVRIKYRDQYFFIEEPKSIQTTCRRCGLLNKVTAED